MVTSTCTPGSIEIEVIWRTISDGECKSMILLWILICKERNLISLKIHYDIDELMLDYKETSNNVYVIDKALWHKFI
jgi:hypothetical protein